MYLNVVSEVEGGLRYWSGIEWWMMQCPHVILKTFRARSVDITAQWNVSLFPSPLLIPPCVLSAPSLWNVEMVLPLLHLLWRFSHILLLCVTCWHTFTHKHECTQTQTCCIFMTSDFDKVMSNSHLSEEVDRLDTGANWIWCDRSCQGSGSWIESHVSQKHCTRLPVFISFSFLCDPRTIIWAVS